MAAAREERGVGVSNRSGHRSGARACRTGVGRRGASVTLLLVVALTAGGCSLRGLNFVQDDRVSILTPGDREEVTLPVTLRWEARDFDGTFAVFVDRAPVPPGRSLEWLAEDDDLCAPQPDCPNIDWFRDRDVYPTAETSLTLTEVPELADDQGRVFHEATVVLIGRDGRRVGESAFTVQFQVERERS